MKRKPKLGKLSSKLGGGAIGSSISTVGSMRPGAIPLSIEYGVSGVKVLQLNGTSPSSIVSAAFLPTPDDLLDMPSKRILFQMDSLPKFLKGEKIKATRACGLIPSGQMLCKHLQIVPTEGVPLEQLAAAQLSAQIGCSPSELLVRCKPVKGANAKGKLEVICFAASREFVGRIMGSFKLAKLEPVGIHTHFDAMARSVKLSDASGENLSKPTLVLDLGTGSTNVLIMHGEEMVFARTIEVGARHFDEAICHQLRCTMLEARQMREQLTVLVPERVSVGAQEGAQDGVAASGLPGMPPPPAAEEASSTQTVSTAGSFGKGPQIDLTEPLEILVDEVSMCMRYHHALFPSSRVDQAIFVGGQSKNPAVCEYLAKALRLPAKVLDPLACLARSGKVPASGVDLRDSQPGWAGAVGSALSPMDL